MIEIEKRPLGWYAIYAGCILLIGTKAEATAIAKACAKEWRVKWTVKEHATLRR